MPDSSQYIQIKRLQTGINGRIANTKSKRGADTYEGYAGSGIGTLPPNALLSNKFIVPEIDEGGGGGGGGNTYTINMFNDSISHKLLSDIGDITITDSDFNIAFSGVTSIPGKNIISLTFTITSNFIFEDTNVSVTNGVGIDSIVISNKTPNVSIPINFNPLTPDLSFNVVFTGISETTTITQVVAEYET